MNNNEIIMHKKPYRFSKNEYVCDITSLLNMFRSEGFIGKRHYLYKVSSLGNTITYAIRVPGRTIGALCTDLDGIIVRCIVEDCDYLEIVDELLRPIMGCKLIFDK